MNKILSLLREKEVCMNCKHCGAELREGRNSSALSCENPRRRSNPAGKRKHRLLRRTQEQPEETFSKPSVKPGAKPWQIVILTLVCVALLAGTGIYDYPGR